MLFGKAAVKRKAEHDEQEEQQQQISRPRVEIPVRLIEHAVENVSYLGGWNSSGQRPERNAAHNKDIADNFPRGHLLNMPTSVQRRIFAKVLRHDEPLVISPAAEAQREAANDLALLQVCRIVRKEAVPLYYVVNSFEVKVENFNAAELLPWYEKAIIHRGNAVAMPIVLAGGEEDCTNWWAMEENRKLVEGGFKKGQQLQLQRVKSFKETSTTAQAPRGDIKLSVTYSPDWSSLKEWLHLYHEGKLPNLMKWDIKGSKDEELLEGVVGAFDMMESFIDSKWETAEKALAGIRGYLVRDHKRWAQNVPQIETPTANKLLGDKDGSTNKMIKGSGATQADIDDFMNDIDEDEEPAFQDPTPRLKRRTLPPSCDRTPTKPTRDHAAVSDHRLSPTARAETQTQDTFSTPMAISKQVIAESDDEDDDKEDDIIDKHFHPPSAAGTGGPKGSSSRGDHQRRR
ncbi:hypothetical protein TI39_contig4416g00005 [Zymoseptoria brevis]|uniref:Uncharacterized protein n=1 Tax=Zymoseptoria brevis TaxID=1047168 RepID=A0A0F4GA62_9PEZI|nr:hypothetical protein TI39_contig4416g00005 [Zymoseptoria brevis]